MKTPLEKQQLGKKKRRVNLGEVILIYSTIMTIVILVWILVKPLLDAEKSIFWLTFFTLLTGIGGLGLGIIIVCDKLNKIIKERK